MLTAPAAEFECLHGIETGIKLHSRRLAREEQRPSINSRVVS